MIKPQLTFGRNAKQALGRQGLLNLKLRFQEEKTCFFFFNHSSRGVDKQILSYKIQL